MTLDDKLDALGIGQRVPGPMGSVGGKSRAKWRRACSVCGCLQLTISTTCDGCGAEHAPANTDEQIERVSEAYWTALRDGYHGDDYD